MTSRALFLVAVCLLLSPPAARAGDREHATVEMDRANAHLEKREYDAAISRFNAARALVPTSSGPYLGLGLAYAATDRCREAIAYLEEYLHRAKTPKPEAAATLADCRARLVPPGRITVATTPAGAQVRFDSETAPVAGLTPFESADLVKGAHRVFLNREGYRPHSAEVAIEPGTTAVVTAALEKLPPPLLTEPLRLPERPPPVVKPPPAPVVRPPPPTFGELAIDATVPSTIYLNNQPMNSDGHLRLRLPPGLYAVFVEREGYRGAEGHVPLFAGERKAFSAPLVRMKTHGGLALGVLFTVIAVIAEATAIAAHFIAAEQTPGTDVANTYNNVEFYGHITFGGSAALAVLGYVLEGVLNRGRVDYGSPYALLPSDWPAAPRR